MRQIRSALSLFLALMAILYGGAALAQSRVALVIGNGAYRNVPALPNPSIDAGDVATSLERLGFSTRRLSDASFDEMRRALLDVGAKARGADMAIVYYAGHGMEVGGENWLIPVDAQLRSDLDAPNEAIGLKSVMLAVSGTKELGLVIMDACRNNPFAANMQRVDRTRAVSRGLIAVSPSDNVLVAFAAKDGTTAQDGAQHNSPFTAALLKYIETPGLEINFLFRNVRDDVLAATRHEQQPFVYGSLSRQAIYLKLPQTADEQTWSVVKTTSDLVLLRRFVDQFPASPHLPEAKDRIAALQAAAEVAARSPAAPAGPHAPPPPCPTGKAYANGRCVAQATSGAGKCLPGVWYRPGTTCGSRLARGTAPFPQR